MGMYFSTLQKVIFFRKRSHKNFMHTRSYEQFLQDAGELEPVGLGLVSFVCVFLFFVFYSQFFLSKG